MNIKRTLAIVLSAIMIFSLFPAASFAYEQKAPYILYGTSDTDSHAVEYYDDVTGTYVALESYDGECIEIDLAHQYDDKTDINNERSVTLRLYGDNVIHVTEPCMFDFDYSLCGIVCTNGTFNGSRQLGNVKLEGYDGATLTIVNERGNTESAEDIVGLLGILANNITIENLDVKVVFKTNRDNIDKVTMTSGIYSAGTVNTLGTTSLDIDLDIFSESETAVGISSEAAEDNGKKYGTLIQSTGDININVLSTGAANCMSYPLNVKIDRTAGRYFPDIYLSTNPDGALHSLSGDTKNKEPAFFSDGSVSEYGFAEGDTYCAIDKARHTERQTVNADDVTKAFPKIVNGDDVETRFEGETFTGFITWYRGSENAGALIKTYDEIKDGSFCYVSLVPKPGYTFNGVKADAYTVPGATVRNSADSGYFTATFYKKNVVNKDLSVSIECGGVKQKDIGTAEVEIVGGQTVTASAAFGGTYSVEPQVKWYLETCHQEKTTKGNTVVTESKKEIGTGKTVSFKSEYKTGKFYYIFAEITPFMDTAFSSRKIRINTKTAVPTITKQPESVYAAKNSQMHFEVEAIGGEFNYQWKYEDDRGYTGDFKDSEYVSGANTNSLTYTPSGAHDTCRVWCEVSNAQGKANSNRVDCVVYESIAIVKDLPTTVYVVPGDDVTLEVEAVSPNNNKDLHYEWDFENYNSHKSGGISLFRSGQTGTVIEDGGKLTIKNITWDEMNQFEFYCYVGVAAQAPLKSKRVRFAKPENYVSDIEINGVTVPVVGENADFNCPVPTGKGYSIKGSAVWTDASGKELTKDSIFAAGEKYTFSATLKTDDNTAFNDDCTATVNGKKAKVVSIDGKSNEVTVRYTFTAVEKPEFVYALSGKTAGVGKTVTFAVKVRNPSGVTYRWYKGGLLVNGATGSEYSFEVSAGDDGVYIFCIASNAAGETFSEQVRLTVKQKLLLGNIESHGTGNSVSVADARLVLRAAVRLDTLTGVDLVLADIDGGGVSVSDARLVLRMAVRLDPLQYTDEY